MVELMKIMLTSFRHYPFSAPDPAAGHFRPTPLPEILGHTGKSGSVSYGVNAPFSWVLMQTRFCLCPARVCFPSPVSSGGTIVGLMVTSSKRAYAIPRSAAPRAPVAGHCWPVPLQETFIHSKAGLAQSLWSLLVHTRFYLCPLSISGGYGVWF